MFRRVTLLFVAVWICWTPQAASAQGLRLSGLLVELISSEVQLDNPGHAAHFQAPLDQQSIPFFFNQQLVAQSSTVPLGSSSGGFSYTFDPAIGTFRRASDSFGPLFAERALTNGRGRVTVGTNFQYSKYTNFEGRDLDSGDIEFYLRHEDVPFDNPYEDDLIQTRLRLELSTATTTFFANVGVTDRWDVAIAVPITRVKMDASIDSTVLRLATPTVPQIHQFPGGLTSKTRSGSGTATGVGDVLLRTKVRFVDSPGGGLAAGVDLRLPTGDAEDLLGTGAVAGTFSLIGSSTNGPVAPHFNVGFTVAGEGDVVDITNEVSYGGGAEFLVNPRVTLNADLFGRSLIDAGRLELTNTTWTFTDQVTGTPGSVDLNEYAIRTGSLNLVNVALGGKVNVGGNLLVVGTVLIPVTSAGVSADFTPVVGFDYTF